MVDRSGQLRKVVKFVTDITREVAERERRRETQQRVGRDLTKSLARRATWRGARVSPPLARLRLRLLLMSRS